MFRNILAVLLILAAGRSTWSAPADEVTETIARAEALYYEADFSKSIELLLQADQLLQQQNGQLRDRISVKLQLALASVGLNNSTQAKNYFRELYALDADHLVDPQQFSPKVIQ